jgi:hypothetical protein
VGSAAESTTLATPSERNNRMLGENHAHTKATFNDRSAVFVSEALAACLAWPRKTTSSRHEVIDRLVYPAHCPDTLKHFCRGENARRCAANPPLGLWHRENLNGP